MSHSMFYVLNFVMRIVQNGVVWFLIPINGMELLKTGSILALVVRRYFISLFYLFSCYLALFLLAKKWESLLAILF